MKRRSFIKGLLGAGAIALIPIKGKEKQPTLPKASQMGLHGMSDNQNPLIMDSDGNAEVWLGEGSFTMQWDEGGEKAFVKRYYE